MFTISQFENLYSLLSVDLVKEDCGIKCQQYCCKTPNTIKYLLPGEDEYFTLHTPQNFKFKDHFLFIGYEGKDELNCACTREFRPFCCRIFPFRPVIDLKTLQIVGLKKASSPGFDEHCWITSPLFEWQEAAILAWQKVLEDEDNLNFYTKHSLFIKRANFSNFSFGQSTSSLLYEVIEEMENLSFLEKWQETASFFDLIGKNNS
jgi:hypothetical protein